MFLTVIKFVSLEHFRRQPQLDLKHAVFSLQQSAPIQQPYMKKGRGPRPTYRQANYALLPFFLSSSPLPTRNWFRFGFVSAAAAA